MHQHTYSKLLIILFLKAIAFVCVISFLGIALAPDEAQYWTWSQDLDFGYYSKPPGIAWQIFLTTALFGTTELGVRFGAILIGFLLSIVVYCLSINCGVSQRGSFWSAILFAFSPLGFYLSFAATTDGGAFLGITMASAVLAKAIFEKKVPNFVLIGLCIGFGALFKWIAFAFFPFLFLALYFYPWIRSRRVLYSVLIALLALIPSLYWNLSHEFATFKHVFFTTVIPKTSAKSGNFFSFLAAQIALLSPVTFVLFLMILFKKKENKALAFCSFFSAGFLLYLMASVTKKIQPNWAAYFYPIGIVLVGWYGIEILKKGIFWMWTALIMALIFSVGAFVIPFTPLPYKWNPFRQSLGWERLENALLQKGYDPQKDFLMADTYQMTSLLSFYGPRQERAYFFNLRGNRKNQFSYWESPISQKGKTGYFVIAEHIDFENPELEKRYLQKLSPFCQNVDYLGSVSLYESNNKSVKRAFLFRCQDYNGTFPQDPEKY